MPQQHVQVAYLAERAAGPGQLPSHVLHPLRVEHWLRRLQEGAQPADRDAMLVQLLRVAAQPGARVVLQDRPVLRLQHRGEVVHRLCLATGRLALGADQPERPEKLRALIGVERTGGTQRPLDPLQRRVVAVHQLHLELTDARYAPAAAGHHHLVDHDLGQISAAVAYDDSLPGRVERRHRSQRPAARGRRQQVAERRRYRLRRPRQLQLQPVPVAWQLQLPGAGAVLGPVAKGETRRRQSMVGGVVIDRAEAPRGQRVAQLAGQRESGARAQLDLAFDGALHGSLSLRVDAILTRLSVTRQAQPPAPVSDLDWDSARMRSLADRAVGLYAEFLDGLDDMPISRHAPAAEVRAAVVRLVPEQGMSDDELIAHLRDVLIEWGVQCGHPRFLAYVTGSGTVPGAVVDMLASGVNMNVGGWQLSPSASEIEQSLVRWFAGRFGTGEGATGRLVSGGAMANMVGLKAARDHMAGWDARRDGMAAGPPLVIYATDETHVVTDRAADALGLGTAAVRRLPVDARLRRVTGALREQMRADRAAGLRPMAVVATAGTTSTGTIDPLAEVAEICA